MFEEEKNYDLQNIPQEGHSNDDFRTSFGSTQASFVKEIFHECCPFGNTPLPLNKLHPRVPRLLTSQNRVVQKEKQLPYFGRRKGLVFWDAINIQHFQKVLMDFICRPPCTWTMLALPLAGLSRPGPEQATSPASPRPRPAGGGRGPRLSIRFVANILLV